jgi:hypothetical protein
MEVILTLSNRITLAGAIPLLVAVALAVLVAAIALAPSRPAMAGATAANCGLSPMFLDMLLDRYGLKSYQCNSLHLGGTADDIHSGGSPRYTLADGEKGDTWDFSGQDLDSFAISDDDAAILKAITDSRATIPADDANTPNVDESLGTGTVVEAGVLYIDLTDNPITVDDVDFKNIPKNVAVVLSADSNITGFQLADYEVTENAAGYVSVAFPNLIPDAQSTLAFTVTLSGDATSDRSDALGAGNTTRLIDFGVVDSADGFSAADDATRTFVANSEAEDKIFYWPITVGKDNSNGDDWDFRATITETTARAADVVPEFDLTNDYADVTVLDADAPAVSVCDRSEHVEDAILAIARVRAAATDATTWDGNDRCGEITSRDLGTIDTLSIVDTDDAEPIADLIAGDFESLSGLTALTITGARSLPSGIFAGVGKAGSDLVTIRFGQNTSTDDDVDKVGNFKPSTIPSHIWDDQEEDQVIILADDLDDDDKGVTSGLDAALYAGEEGGHFFVLTSTTTAKYVLGNSVVFGTGADATTFLGGSPELVPDATATDKPMVVRFAVDIPNVDDKDKGDRNMWLFLFNTDNDDTVGAPDADPDDASDLKALAIVAITDDD